MAIPPVVVIGASAGGVEAVTRVVADLPADFPAAVFVAMHFPEYSTSVLPRILTRAGALSASHPREGQPIVGGRIYVAPPDRHVLVLSRTIHLERGPRENGNRPAIDPLFRSAALSNGQRVVGVILTGALDDGTAGLLAIKQRGGMAVVQDPADALFPSMPRSAIDHVEVDYVLPLHRIASQVRDIVQRLAGMPVSALRAKAAASDDVDQETRYDEIDLSVIQDVGHHPGEPSLFGCPDCGGVLWEIRDRELVRYRCRVGHAWTADGLLARQEVELDTAFWTALRALEENAQLLRMMGERAGKRGNDILAAKYERDSRTAERRAGVIRDALLSSAETRATPAGQAAGTGGT